MHAHGAALNHASSSSFLLLLHGSLETFMVNLEALVLSHFFCQFNWETVGIIEFENILAFQGILASFLQLGQEMIQVA